MRKKGWALLVIHLFGFFGLLHYALANKMQQQFDHASQQYKDANKNTFNQQNLSHKVHPQSYTTGNIDQIEAKNYYSDEISMDAAKQKSFQHNTAAQSVMVTNNSNKHTIDSNNPAYKKAVSYQDDAEKILSNDKDRYTCTEIQRTGSQKTHIETCQVSNITPMQCSRYPVVNIIDATIPAKDQSFDLTSSRFWRTEPWHGHIYFNLPHTGVLKSIEVILQGGFPHRGGGYTHYWLRIQPFHPGLIDHYHNPSGTFSLKFNNLSHRVTANQQAYLWINGREWITVPDFSVRYRGVIEIPAIPKKEAKVVWTDNCQHINQNVCVKTTEICSEGAATRNFGGVNVHQDCWKYDLAYTCGYKKNDNCDEIAKRCNFVSQQCIEEAHGYCFAYERTYQCSEAQEGNKEIICGNANSIQFTQVIEKGDPNDFLKAVSALAGASEAGDSVKKSQSEVNILKGEVYDCGEGAMGVYDCCDGGGNFLHHCSDREKALQKAREKKIASFAGRYCGKKVLGVCVAHRQNWCVFDSKLARVLQEQGRVKQLGIGFGSGEHANCQGITPDQLQRIDFTKIDFREFFDEVKSKATLPDQNVATSLSNKFGSGTTTPEMNQKLKNHHEGR